MRNPLRGLTKGGAHQSPLDPSNDGRQGEEKSGQPPLPNKSKWNTVKAGKRARSQGSSGGGVHKISIKDEDLDLLGEVVLTGKVTPSSKETTSKVEVDARLTTKAFIWGLHCVRLEDVVAISYNDGSRRFTVHSYEFTKKKWITSTFSEPQRTRTDLHFLAANGDEVLQWVSAFAEQGCYINVSRHPLASSKKKSTVVDAGSSPAPPIRCRARPTVLVILNPRSGRGRAKKVFVKAEAVLKLAGFRLTVVETTSARHAQTLASTVDLSTCPDGIICVGGDGIINEVLNGLLSRDNAQQASEIPIGIIPAGSDNSLVWTVLGIRDPISAAVAIVKGGMVGMDVLAVEWTKTGAVHLGLTVAYYGFMSDVLELSGKYQRRFGPLRYFVAGALKLLRLPHYKCEIEFVPVNVKDKTNTHVEIPVPESDFTDLEAGTRTLEAIFASHTGLDAANEPSEYVRGLDAKTKKQLSGRLPSAAAAEEALAVHYPLPGSPSPRPRTRSKSRSDRSWSGLSIDSESARMSRANSAISSNGEMENAGNGLAPKWDSPAPKWDTSAPKWDSPAPKWDSPAPKWDSPVDSRFSSESESVPSSESTEPRWEHRQGYFLGIMVCNHQCKTVQCLPSQVLAPTAEHDDGTLDLIIVRAVGRFQLLRFFWLMQFNRHLKLPFVEYVKVRQAVLKTGGNDLQGCGIDGELLTLNGPISAGLLPFQCRLIGRAKQRK